MTYFIVALACPAVWGGLSSLYFGFMGYPATKFWVSIALGPLFVAVAAILFYLPLYALVL